MSGFIDRAFHHYVIEHDGDAAWKEIMTQAGLDRSEFNVTTSYDDGRKIALVTALAAARGCDEAAVLKDFGRYWMRYVLTTSFAKLLTIVGNDFEQIITRLDDLHAMIKVSLPESRPPSFGLKRLEDGRLEILYTSERAGFFPFVDGLFEGIGQLCHQEITTLDFEQLSSSSARWVVHVDAASSRAA